MSSRNYFFYHSCELDWQEPGAFSCVKPDKGFEHYE